MNKVFKTIVLISMLVGLYSIGFSQHHHTHECSIPAYPHPQNKTQPDGEQITIKMFGNESMYYVETIDGYTVTKDRKDGFYKYVTADTDGDLLLTDIVVHNADNRSKKEQFFLNGTPKKLRVTGKALKEKQALQKSLKQSSACSLPGEFPSYGTNRALMVLMEFRDRDQSEYKPAKGDIDNLLNQDGYSVNGQTGSFKDYYRDISYGNLIVNSDVIGWYTSLEDEDYYGADEFDENGDLRTRDVNESQLVIEAVNAAYADPNINLSDYDNDNDGVVDVVMIMHSGEGQEASGESNDIWSSAGTVSGLSFNGISISRYALQPAIFKNYGTTIANIGVLCHEFGHALGLPDLYDATEEPFVQGIGKWGLMGSGIWNNGGKTPAQMCAWSKVQLGWITPTVMTSPISIGNIPTIDVSPTCFRLNTTTNTEYFLISVRQKNKWDAGLPEEGVAIWHIDDTQCGNYLSKDLPQVYLEDIYGIDNTTFNENTSPDSKTYEGYNSGNCVSNINLTGATPNLAASFNIDCAYNECPVKGNEFFHISNVTLLGGFNNPGFKEINNSTSYDGYSIYNNDDPTNLSVFGTYYLEVFKPEDDKCTWKAWIDYNQDGTFSNAELILDKTNWTNLIAQSDFTPPQNALMGTTRMRVKLTVPSDCDNSGNIYEEIEDYYVSICSDIDQDGVCDVEDCEENDPNIPTEFGFSCDDDNPNTNEDRIQIDGCTCAGSYDCEPFLDLSGTINTGIFPAQNIQSDGQIAAGSTVYFIANEAVDLLPGFDAQGGTGTDFMAWTDLICPVNKQETNEEQITIRNYPNPFTRQTTIEFELSKDAPVTLFVSDAMGRQVEVLLDNETKVEGPHLITFDGNNYSAGMYYYTIQAGAYTGTQKMALVK